MPSSTHYRHRAEGLRIAMLLTPNPIAAARLRNLVERYRILAEREDKKIVSPTLDSAERQRAFSEKS